MRGRMTAGILIALVGAVWIGQGLGVLRSSSFMVDDPRWAAAGVAAVIVGGVLAVRAWRSGRQMS